MKNILSQHVLVYKRMQFDNKWAQQWDELQKADREKKGIACDVDLEKCFTDSASEEPDLRSPINYQPFCTHLIHSTQYTVHIESTLLVPILYIPVQSQSL